jgi:hypothetical protein
MISSKYDGTFCAYDAMKACNGDIKYRLHAYQKGRKKERKQTYLLSGFGADIYQVNES